VTRLSVVIVSTPRSWRGGEDQAWQLALGLRERGHDCCLVTPAEAPLATRARDAGIDWIPLANRARRPSSIWALRRALRKRSIDVLHYNDPHAMTAAGLACWRRPIPLRVTARRVDFPLSFPRRYRWFCDRVICVSAAVANVCERSGLPRSMLDVVHDGVDPARIAAASRGRGRASLQLGADESLLLCVAALVDHKGHRYLLEALPAVLAQFPRLIVALAGAGDLEQPLRQQAAQLGLAERVRFLGFRGDVHDLICAADLFVLPSHMEGLCSTLIDVMLARVPIVATSAGGIPEVLGDDRQQPAAWIVPPRSPTALAESLLGALSSPAEGRDRAERAGRRARQNFTAAQMVERTLAVYRRAVPGDDAATVHGR
jgi:L-malate glycosyltransferase